MSSTGCIANCTFSRAFSRFRQTGIDLMDEISGIDPAQNEEEIGLLVELGADAVEHGSNVLAH
jgi:hypothetical protein